MKSKNQKHKTVQVGSKTFDVINIVFMVFVIVVCAYPIWFVLMASFSDTAAINKNLGTLIWPKGFSFIAYKEAFKHPLILSGFANIFKILLFALPLNMLMTIICGYVMAAKNMMFKKYIIWFIMFTMFFGGGLIPTYLNIKSLGLYDSLWALIIPGALGVYNAIICKTAIEGIPDSLIESAYMDGAGELTILFKIITPLIKPTLAVLLLYYGVGHWNSWFGASIYIKHSDLLPIQNVLRSVLLSGSDALQSGAITGGDTRDDFTETIKYAAIVISTVPILCIYPFLQKYFVKGVMIGAVKE